MKRWQKAEEFLEKDKYIGPLVKKYGPCKINKRSKKYYFEDLVSSIVGQQLSGKAAVTICNRLEKELKGDVSPDKVIRKRDATLRKCGLSFAKISYIKDLSRHVKENKLHISSLSKHSDEQIIEELVAVKGIGQWTAEMFLMFTLARPDIFPIGDLGIRNGIKVLIPSFAKASEGQVVEFAKRWKPYRTVASWYIWKNYDFLTFIR